MTRQALENAPTVALPQCANVKPSINDFMRIGKKVPVPGDLKPSGKASMAHLSRVGGARRVRTDRQREIDRVWVRSYHER